MGEHHYFAATPVSWATAATRQEAINKAARIAGAEAIKRNVKMNKGLYFWSCRVDLPEKAGYIIEEYMPKYVIEKDKPIDAPVPKSAIIEGRIQNIKGHVTIDDKASA